MSNKLNGPLIYDSLDKPNADQKQPIVKSPDYAFVWVVFIVIVSLLIAALVIYVIVWLNATESVIALWVINVAVIMGIVGVIAAGIVYLFALAFKHSTHSLNDGIPVSVFSVLNARYDKAFEAITARYFDMWTRRMEHSLYSGVSTLTLDQSAETSTTSVQTQTEESAITAQELPLGKDKSVLEDLRDRGIINRSDRSVFIGHDEKPTPRYIEWDRIGLCGIAGKAGSGKSSTMRLMLAQFALSGVGIILVDGHGRYGQQNLASTVTALSGSFIVPVAKEDDSIYDAIKLAYDIALWRVYNWKESHSPPMIALVIDELANILMRFDGDRAQFIIKALVFFATEARKTNVKTFVASQNWTQDFIGAASIRKSMNTVILHRTAPDEVSKFTNMLAIKRSAPNMRVGEAWIINDEDPTKVYVPKVTQDDLLSIAHLVPVYEMADDVFHVVSPEFQKPDETLEADRETAYETDETLETDLPFMPNIGINIVYNMQFHARKGVGKKDVIFIVLKAKPGATQAWKAASKLYDNAKEKGII